MSPSGKDERTDKQTDRQQP